MKAQTTLFLVTVTMLGFVPGLTVAQERKANPKAPAEAKKAVVAKKTTPTGVKIVVEWIEIEQAEVTAWLMENRLENDATKMRRELQRPIEEGDASVVDTIIVSSRSGQRAKAESVSEIIYPTEYDPAEIPQKVKLGGKSEAPFTSPNPTAFETRNVGVSVEVDPVISADGKLIDLNIVPEIVEYLGERRMPHEDTPQEFQVAMPEFYTARVTTSVSVPNGGYVLLGTVRLSEPFDEEREQPIVLVFVRADAY